jgi:hypothetical protein
MLNYSHKVAPGAVAAVMGAGRIIANETTPSPYAARGFVFL